MTRDERPAGGTGTGIDIRWLVIEGDVDFFAVTKRIPNRLHDPQTAGLAAALRERGGYVAWRCHPGLDETDEWTDDAWGFLRPLVEPAHACVFSREELAPGWVDRRWLRVIPPSLDPFSPKNVELSAAEVEELVHRPG